MKKRTVYSIIFLIVLADQLLKIYIKTHYHIGQSHKVLGNWFQLYFVENKGMAYGLEFGGDWGKIFLTLFRMAAVVYGVFYIARIISQKYPRGFIICVALIFAGALGNLIDSMFYGLLFEYSNPDTKNIAAMFPAHGYAGFMHGNVVDMFYFPLIDTRWPSWLPFIGGKPFSFFDYIFNIADASVCIGVIAIILFRRRFFKKETESSEAENE